MPKIKVNGREIEAPEGKKLLEVLLDEGVYVPHYCWHPGLKPHGNCRMCLCKVSNSRKMEVACTITPVEGLEVTTEGPDIDTARKTVMEYLLINHPLDCPICDKAGECQLQDYTFTYRHGLSRFGEDKVIRHTKDLGPNVKIWGNRCISCTRCVRFCDDIVGTGELAMVQRGDHQVVDVHPEVPLDNPMSLNVVDLCPVGALNDKNFLYTARVWFSERTETVCGSCSRGCNVTATTHKSEIKRLQARENHQVNGYWICDAGRLNTGFVAAENRLKLGKGSLKDLAARLRAVTEQHGAGSVAIVGTPWATVEEVHLLKELAAALQARVGWIGRTEGERWVSKSGFAIETDKTPNRRGVQHVMGAVDAWEPLAAAARGGEVRAMLIVNGLPDWEAPADLLAATEGLDLLAVASIQGNALVEKAHFVVPSACWAEKDGVWINQDGHVQRIRAMVPAPGQARPEAAWLQDLLVHLGARKAAISAEGVFKQAMPGLDYGRLGNQGVRLARAVQTTDREAVLTGGER